LANRLGIWQMKWELEDLSLRFTEPEIYNEISKELDETREQRLAFMRGCVERIQMLLKANGIEAEVSGRPKHIYSIYKKMVRKHLRFDQLFDIRAVRIIVDTVEHCYEVLSLVHENFTVLSKEYDDYIANPKPNGYQSLHTVVTDPHGRPVEIQIRTRAMHEFAELGVAAHWRYKETGNSNKDKGAEAEEQRVASVAGLEERCSAACRTRP
jgi:GTP pyrophosphokinase